MGVSPLGVEPLGLRWGWWGRGEFYLGWSEIGIPNLRECGYNRIRASATWRLRKVVGMRQKHPHFWGSCPSPKLGSGIPNFGIPLGGTRIFPGIFATYVDTQRVPTRQQSARFWLARAKRGIFSEKRTHVPLRRGMPVTDNLGAAQSRHITRTEAHPPRITHPPKIKLRPCVPTAGAGASRMAMPVRGALRPHTHSSSHGRTGGAGGVFLRLSNRPLRGVCGGKPAGERKANVPSGASS